MRAPLAGEWPPPPPPRLAVHVIYRSRLGAFVWLNDFCRPADLCSRQLRQPRPSVRVHVIGGRQLANRRERARMNSLRKRRCWWRCCRSWRDAAVEGSSSAHSMQIMAFIGRRRKAKRRLHATTIAAAAATNRNNGGSGGRWLACREGQHKRHPLRVCLASGMREQQAGQRRLVVWRKCWSLGFGRRDQLCIAGRSTLVRSPGLFGVFRIHLVASSACRTSLRRRWASRQHWLRCVASRRVELLCVALRRARNQSSQRRSRRAQPCVLLACASVSACVSYRLSVCLCAVRLAKACRRRR